MIATLLGTLASVAAQTTAFVGVHVVPMDREIVLRNQTVVVEGAWIVAVGDASKVEIPKGATVVDGKGKYLIPGLMDMHTHLWSDDDLPDRFAEDEFKVMIANGVTTIRIMLGTPEHLQYRPKIGKGEMIGPNLFVASPGLTNRPQSAALNGKLIGTPEEARSAIRDFKSAGYDFIKIVDAFKNPSFDAAADEAKKQGIRLVGHVDPEVGVSRALAAGQHVEHLDAYMEAVLKDDSPIKVSVSDRNVYRTENWVSIDHIDENKVDAIAKETAKSGTYTCPTLNFFKSVVAETMDEAEIKARPDFLLTPRAHATALLSAIKRIEERKSTPERRAKWQATRNALTLKILRHGGKIMAGSDSPDAFHVYGFALHRELKALKAAGLTNYEVLQSATTTPAAFLMIDKRVGMIQRGYEADLVLLEANPLDDIGATEKRVGVMRRGVWRTNAELQGWIADFTKRMQAEP